MRLVPVHSLVHASCGLRSWLTEAVGNKIVILANVCRVSSTAKWFGVDGAVLAGLFVRSCQPTPEVFINFYILVLKQYVFNA